MYVRMCVRTCTSVREMKGVEPAACECMLAMPIPYLHTSRFLIQRFRHSAPTEFHVRTINRTTVFLNLGMPVVDRQTCDITRRVPELTWAEEEWDTRY